MARCARVDVGDLVYHVINRAVGRLQIFNTPADYLLFEQLLREAQEMTDMRILAYTAMPNHWHLELYPRSDGDMGVFMHWLTNAHTRRVHVLTNTVGTGPLYQGRYKSFLVEDDAHLLMVLKYIERNPVRARLVDQVDAWRWGSAYIRQHGSPQQKQLLAELPVVMPKDYSTWVNTPDSEENLLMLRSSANKGTPFGRDTWVQQMVDVYKLESTTRTRGRPSTV